jgi:DNA-binding transcriptional LysR family regulator
LPSSGRNIPWLIREQGVVNELPTEGSYRTSGEYMSAVTLARSGAGLFQTYRFIVEEDLRAGRLVEVLQPYAGGTRVFTLLYPHGRHLPLRVRMLIDFLVERLAQ